VDLFLTKTQKIHDIIIIEWTMQKSMFTIIPIKRGLIQPFLQLVLIYAAIHRTSN
jgi:hypothetical protein